MKLYAINNIVATTCNDVFYISEVGEYLHLHNKENDNYTITKEADIYLRDIELSDWFFNSLFPNKESEEIWGIDRLDAIVMDIPYYRIEKYSENLYTFKRGARDGRLMTLALDNVRIFQNIYNFFREYENGDYLEEEIDSKIKKLFKLI